MELSAHEGPSARRKESEGKESAGSYLGTNRGEFANLFGARPR